MPFVYTTPPHLRPVELWRLRVGSNQEAHAVLAPTEASVTVVWYLDDVVQDAAEFQERDTAIRWAEEVRPMLTARLAH